jgi:hypothetical protein
LLNICFKKNKSRIILLKLKTRNAHKILRTYVVPESDKYFIKTENPFFYPPPNAHFFVFWRTHFFFENLFYFFYTNSVSCWWALYNRTSVNRIRACHRVYCVLPGAHRVIAYRARAHGRPTGYRSASVRVCPRYPRLSASGPRLNRAHPRLSGASRACPCLSALIRCLVRAYARLPRLSALISVYRAACPGRLRALPQVPVRVWSGYHWCHRVWLVPVRWETNQHKQ